MCGCAVLEGQGVLAVDGNNYQDGDGILNTVEFYNFTSKTWTLQQNLPDELEESGMGPILLTVGNSVLGLFDDTSKVYKRAEDESWAPIDGVTLPNDFRDNRYRQAFLIPSTYDMQCE